MLLLKKKEEANSVYWKQMLQKLHQWVLPQFSDHDRATLTHLQKIDDVKHWLKLFEAELERILEHKELLLD